jgi:hypothetical protein
MFLDECDLAQVILGRIFSIPAASTQDNHRRVNTAIAAG